MSSRTDSGQALHVDVVHGALRDAILSGEIPQGAVLSQVQLARQFGVSRTPLREAVRMLQAEGFIDAAPNQRIRVASLSVSELEQLYTLRITLEAVAIRISVPRFTDGDLERLRTLTRQLEESAAARDVNGWEHPHQEFHRALVSYAGDVVTELMERLQDNSNRYRRMYVTQGPRAWWHTTAEHEAIRRACERRDPAGAAAELARHYARTALTLIAMIDPEHDPVSVRAAVAMVIPSQPAGEDGAASEDGKRVGVAGAGVTR
jgi:DNA-binding GntR family transcriptional regulator